MYHAWRTGKFQSTPSAWRETCHTYQRRTRCNRISIHSLRMEGDTGAMSTASTSRTFQSTPSAWRETALQARLTDLEQHFNPLPPHGGRHLLYIFYYTTKCISIHSLRMEGDPAIATTVPYTSISIHSLRMEGDAMLLPIFGGAENISIHSLRMEGDLEPFYSIYHIIHISIHSLRMEGDRKTPFC